MIQLTNADIPHAPLVDKFFGNSNPLQMQQLDTSVQLH